MNVVAVYGGCMDVLKDKMQEAFTFYISSATGISVYLASLTVRTIIDNPTDSVKDPAS